MKEKKFWKQPFSKQIGDNEAYISILTKEVQNLRLEEFKKGRINK